MGGCGCSSAWEGWHTTEETLPDPAGPDDQGHDDQDHGDGDEVQDDDTWTEVDDPGSRRVRSTRRRQDVPDLPRLPVEHRTLGRTFVGNDGEEINPSMFNTTTLASYGKVRTDGTPLDPGSYDYRAAALDAMHFPKLIDRLIQNLRRCAGYRVQYFGVIEAQKRLAPHFHAAMRGVIPRRLFRQVVQATYHQLWWPHSDDPVYTAT
ncbi:MAG: replication initiator [Nocardioidaceae bacterium]